MTRTEIHHARLRLECLCREDALAVGETDLTQTGELMRFTISANMAGIPAISIPVGHCFKGAALQPCVALDVCAEWMRGEGGGCSYRKGSL